MTTFTGTTGNDILPLTGADNSGDDILYGLAGNDRLDGGSGNDLLVGGTGIDLLYGGTGVDTVSYAASTAGVYVNSVGSSYGGEAGPSGERLFDIENLIGSSYNDILYGNTADNSLTGGSGNDRLYGHNGNDTLDGGDGADMLDGGIGLDALYGGLGDDALYGNDGSDTLNGADGADTIDGGIGSDALYGGSGDDTLRDGRDTYLSGNDYLDGGAGNDVLVDGVGGEQLTGGTGADRFVWEGDVYFDSYIQEAVVRDFASGFDKIDMSAVDADVIKSGIQHFTWLGVDQPFTGRAGELTFALGVIRADLDGLPTADFEIQLNGVTTMSASDFIL